MEIKIREAKIEDLKAILDLNHKLCEKENKEFDDTIDPNYPYTQHGTEEFKENIENDNALTLVAEDNGKIIGYLSGGVAEVEDYRTVKDIYEAWSVWVEEEYRSKGIGADFFQRFESWSKQRGAKRIKAVVSAQNERAIKLYKKGGFEDYDVVMEKSLG